MMFRNTSLFAAMLAAGFALPAAAQAQQDLGEVDTAAERMVAEYYVIEPRGHMTPSHVISRLQELGYTGIDDFEWGHYEVEAVAPNGEEVEIEIDPVTGAILDGEEDWF